MANPALQIAGLASSILGWIGTIAVTVMPQWRVTAFTPTSANLVTAQDFWEGIWMQCVFQMTGQQQCKMYDSLLSLSPDMQAARGLMCVACAMGFFALIITVVGMQCTHCVENERTKAYIAISGGVMFLTTALLLLIPICWTANAIIRDFYDPTLGPERKRELGAALYIGWASAFCLVAGGALLTCSCPPKDTYQPVRSAHPLSQPKMTVQPRRTVTSPSYSMREFV
uniref:claudin-4-like n=1 Tax=Myxine glutinosa TaxID=7769 RepID=UPI00358E738A